MVTTATRRFTEAEYLALERASSTKHEFVAGAIVAMAGARPPHNMLAANMTAAMVSLLAERDLTGADATLELPALGGSIAVATIYAKVVLDEGRRAE